MEREEFIKKKPHLYHLTSKENAENILLESVIYSTTKLVDNSDLTYEEKNNFLTEKRPGHKVLSVNNKSVMIRDQAPISIKVLSKSLTGNWTPEQFINFLNDRVFFWPTINRLERHYTRYEKEEPIIFRVKSSDIFELNPNVRLCRLNSGATRCSHHHNGAAPPRGSNTFPIIEDYDLPVGTVAEVTFLDQCNLPRSVELGRNPNGPWEQVNLPYDIMLG